MRIYKKSLRRSRDLKQIISIINTINDMLCEQTYTVYTHKHALLQGQFYDIIPSHSMWQLHMVKDKSMLRVRSYMSHLMAVLWKIVQLTFCKMLNVATHESPRTA